MIELKKIKKIISFITVAAMLLLFACCAADDFSQTEDTEDSSQTEETQDSDQSESSDDLNLRDIYGSGYYYLFTYKGEDYTAIYTYDNWCVYDSYKIKISATDPDHDRSMREVYGLRPNEAE